MRPIFIVVIFMTFAFYKNCPQDPLCLSCWGAYCISCAYSYPDQFGFCQLDNPIPNCYSYNNKNICVRCKDGYLYNQELKTCVLSTENANCVEFEISSGKCLSCRDGLLPSKTTGKCDDLTRKCSIQFCEICRSSSIVSYPICDKCAYGYTSNFNGTSYNCVKTDSNCRVSIMGVCSICNYGFYYGNKECLPNPQTNMDFVPNYTINQTSSSLSQKSGESTTNRAPAKLLTNIEKRKPNDALDAEKTSAQNSRNPRAESDSTYDKEDEVFDFKPEPLSDRSENNTVLGQLLFFTKKTIDYFYNALFEQKS